jgi:alpha-methylacyl-CoA racemase
MTALRGVRVASIALNLPGPLAASYLRDAGAHIIKIEPPSGDPLAALCPTWYAELHDRVVVERIDLKNEAGQTRMRAILADTDLLLSSQRPAALVRLGLDAATLLAPRARTASLRCLNIVGERARPEVAGHDLTYLARAGLLGSEVPRTLIADVLGAERVFATALLLMQRPAGTSIEVGLFDSLAPLMAAQTHHLTGPGSILGGGLPAYGIYDAREGRVAVAALEPHFRAGLYAALGLPDGTSLRDAFRNMSADEWEAWAEARDLPIAKLR